MTFATAEDLRRTWRTWPTDLTEDHVTAALELAADWLRAEFDLPENPPRRLSGALRIVSMAMAKRAVLGDGNENVSGQMNVASAFTQQKQFLNADGSFYLKSQERAMLEAAMGSAPDAVSMTAKGW